jgi:Zn-dependent protease
MLEWLIAVIACVVVHEAGHILAALIFRVPVRKIGLCWRGVYIQRARSAGWPEIAICLAGPAVNCALAVALWHVDHQFAFYNLVFGVVNLLPFQQSDCSHALAELSREVK